MVSRAEHRRETLLKLSAAATEAFSEHGSKATLDDIANRAGVARRTIFRYVDSKEDLAFIHPVLWLDVFDEAMGAAADLGVRDRLMSGARALSLHIDRDPLPVRMAMQAAMSDPALMRGYGGITRLWVDRIAQEIRGTSTEHEVIFKAGVLGAAVMGVIDAALSQWYLSDPPAPLEGVVMRGLDYLAPIID